MHDDQVPIDGDLVSQLIAEQQPQWRSLALRPVDSTGTANAMFRLGDDLVVRLPLRPGGARAIEREQRWLPVLAPSLPVPVPVPLAVGHPTNRYPMAWSVAPWFDGSDATVGRYDRTRLARDLARFVLALRSVDAAAGPRPSSTSYGRGVPLAARDELTRSAIASASHLIDPVAVTSAWERALAAEPWRRPGVWIHGDLAGGNLIVADGELRAVIDFTSAGVGDPACDLLVAWELFDGPSRGVFRQELAVDDACWDRGRGWALSTAIVALPYYEQTNPFMVDQARRKIEAVLADA